MLHIIHCSEHVLSTRAPVVTVRAPAEVTGHAQKTGEEQRRDMLTSHYRTAPATPGLLKTTLMCLVPFFLELCNKIWQLE